MLVPNTICLVCDGGCNNVATCNAVSLIPSATAFSSSFVPTFVTKLLCNRASVCTTCLQCRCLLLLSFFPSFFLSFSLSFFFSFSFFFFLFLSFSFFFFLFLSFLLLFFFLPFF